jgi:hypothetical protein
LPHIYWDRPPPATRTGVIDHLAFSARGLTETRARFDARGLKYELRQQPGSGTWQIFSLGPNGVKVELDFDASDAP